MRSIPPYSGQPALTHSSARMCADVSRRRPQPHAGSGISRRGLLGSGMKTIGLTMIQGSVLYSASGLDEARRFLREEQAKAAKGRPGFPYANRENVTEQSLSRLMTQRQYVPTGDPNMVRRGVLHFDRRQEEERIRRSGELVRRVEPGPFEDPGYFAFLAYEAASFEMTALPQEGWGGFSRFLLGTVHTASVNAFSQQSEADGYWVVLLNSGFIDFVYQSAKAVIEALHPVRSVDNKSFVQANTDPQKIRAELKVNDAPANRVYRTLESYFFGGYPRAFTNETLLEEHIPPLESLVSMAERWTLAHEYGHGLALDLDFRKAPNPSWAEEFFADGQATILTVLSALSLDGVPPEVPLSGGVFTLACLNLVRRAYSIVTTGQDSQDSGSATHPPYKRRAEQNVTVFRHYFDVQYKDGGRAGLDWQFKLRKNLPAEDTFVREHREGVYVFANVLFDIWPAVKQRLAEQFKAKRPLHEMWR